LPDVAISSSLNTVLEKCLGKLLALLLVCMCQSPILVCILIPWDEELGPTLLRSRGHRRVQIAAIPCLLSGCASCTRPLRGWWLMCAIRRDSTTQVLVRELVHQTISSIVWVCRCRALLVRSLWCLGGLRGLLVVRGRGLLRVGWRIWVVHEVS